MNPQQQNGMDVRLARRGSIGSLRSVGAPQSAGFYHPAKVAPGGAHYDSAYAHAPSLGRGGGLPGRDSGINPFTGRAPQSPGGLPAPYFERNSTLSGGGGSSFMSDPRRRGSVQGRTQPGLSLSSLGLYSDADYANQDEEDLFSEANEIFGYNKDDDAYEEDSDAFETADQKAKRKRRPKTPPDCCSACGDTTTPEWRSGPAGVRELCNGCGLLAAKRAKERKAKGQRQPSKDNIDELKAELWNIGFERSKRAPGYSLPPGTEERIIATFERTRRQTSARSSAKQTKGTKLAAAALIGLSKQPGSPPARSRRTSILRGGVGSLSPPSPPSRPITGMMGPPGSGTLAHRRSSLRGVDGSVRASSPPPLATLNYSSSSAAAFSLPSTGFMYAPGGGTYSHAPPSMAPSSSKMSLSHLTNPETPSNWPPPPARSRSPLPSFFPPGSGGMPYRGRDPSPRRGVNGDFEMRGRSPSPAPSLSRSGSLSRSSSVPRPWNG